MLVNKGFLPLCVSSHFSFLKEEEFAILLQLETFKGNPEALPDIPGCQYQNRPGLSPPVEMFTHHGPCNLSGWRFPL